METVVKKRVAIVGAGIAGLVAGYELTKAGHDVVVFEKEKIAGGRMQTKTKDGLRYDAGADFFIGHYDLVRQYIEELGIPWHWSGPNNRHRIMRGGEAYYIELTSLVDLLFRFRLLSFRARLRLVWWAIKLKLIPEPLDFFHLSENPAHLRTMSAATYLREQISPEVADYIADPFTGVMQFHRTDEISAAALFALMRMMITGGVRVWYTPGGMAILPFALAKRLNVQNGVAVTSVTPKGNKVEVVHDGVSELFDSVVVATTGSVARTIVKALSPSATEMFARLSYAATMTVAFSVPVNLFSDRVHLTYVPYVENKIVAGYDNQVCKSASLEHAERSLLVVYLHEAAARELATRTKDEIFSAVLTELQKVCPEIADCPKTEPRSLASKCIRKQGFSFSHSLIQPHDFTYWPEAMPKFAHTYLDSVVAFEAKGQGENNIYLAGDYLNAVWAEGAARCGKRVAEMIINQA